MADTFPQPIELPPESPLHPIHALKPPDVVPLEQIRREVETLSSSEKLDKEAALQMTRLFHSMELLMAHEINTRDSRIASLQHNLQEQRLRVELDRIATRQIQEGAMMVSTPHARGVKRMSR